jgi:hypothetical protein
VRFRVDVARHLATDRRPGFSPGWNRSSRNLPILTACLLCIGSRTVAPPDDADVVMIPNNQSMLGGGKSSSQPSLAQSPSSILPTTPPPAPPIPARLARPAISITYPRIGSDERVTRIPIDTSIGAPESQAHGACPICRITGRQAGQELSIGVWRDNGRVPRIQRGPRCRRGRWGCIFVIRGGGWSRRGTLGHDGAAQPVSIAGVAVETRRDVRVLIPATGRGEEGCGE